jgi:hypothetical protein
MSVANALLGFKGAGIAANDDRMNAWQGKQAAAPIVSTQRSVAECVGAQQWSVAAVLARAAKKILPEA